MPNSVYNDSKQEVGSFKLDVESQVSQINEKVERCGEIINAPKVSVDFEEPSPRTQRIIGKIFSNIREERGMYTKEKVERCRESNRSWLATGERKSVTKDYMGLFNENKDSALESEEVQEYRNLLKERLSVEGERINVLLSQKA